MRGTENWQRIMLVVLALAAVTVTGSALVRAQDASDSEPTVEVCIDTASFVRDTLGGNERLRIKVAWQAYTVMDEDTAALERDYIDRFGVFYSTTDSNFINEDKFWVYQAGAEDSLYFVPDDDVDTTKVSHWFLVKAYRTNGDSVASGVFHNTFGQTETKERYTPAAWLFWIFQEMGWSEPLERFDASGSLGRRAFDVLSIFLVLGSLIFIPRTWWLFRSTRLFLVNREIAGYNECDTAAKDESAKLDNADFREPFKDAIKTHLSRRSFHGRIFGTIADGVPRFLEIAARKKDRLDHVPSIKLIRSVASAINNKQNLEKAVAIRVSAEYEDLRKRSLIDVLWALGATAPLIGLFGTVTGISAAFRELSSGTIKTTEIMAKLGGGIYEALWTTIFGLICGILYMVHYYYYSYKLDRIYSVWTSFGAEVWDGIKSEEINEKPSDEDRPANKTQ